MAATSESINHFSKGSVKFAFVILTKEIKHKMHPMIIHLANKMIKTAARLFDYHE